jgi:tetratricopeptide (TPR) repeat protein
VRLGTCLLEEEREKESEKVLGEALSLNPQNVPAMLGLARTFFSLATKARSGEGERDRERERERGKDSREREREDYLDQCLSQCTKVLTASPREREAAMLCADVYLLKADSLSLTLSDKDSEREREKDGEGERKSAGASNSSASGDLFMEKACDVLTHYLTLSPNDYLALEKAILVLRKAGRLTDAQQYVTFAEKSDRRCVSHAGYHYCQGLVSRFTNDIGKAIFEFNYARKDDFWAAAALTHMIELYLNPDQDGIWEERESGPVDDQTRANIAAAEELLKELRPIAK